MIERILPPSVAATEAFGDVPNVVLFPEENAAIAGAVESRRREFATARACARAALGRLGKPPVPLLPGPGGAPRWPDGVTGSITHCPGYRAAVVASTRHVVSLGVDAEPNEPLPNHDMLGIVARESERIALTDLSARSSGVCWDRLLFCAKESIYKTWFPLTRRWLDFESAEIVIDSHAGTLIARLLVEGPVVNGSPLSVLRGRWVADHGLVVTAIVVPA